MERVNIRIGPVVFDHAEFDAENDVLYLHIGEPEAGAGEETPEGHSIRYAPGTNRIVGLTMMIPLDPRARRTSHRHDPGDDRDDRRRPGAGARYRLIGLGRSRDASCATRRPAHQLCQFGDSRERTGRPGA